MQGPRREPFVIVGGGPAAASAARVLAESDLASRVVVVTAEQVAPYDRTTLSKRLLLEPGTDAPPLWDEDEKWLAQLDLRAGQRVTGLDLDRSTVRTDSGDVIPFGRLLLATGAEPRRLQVPGTDGPGVHYLRDIEDAAALRRALPGADRVVVVGGGVIGLEVAAAARQLGSAVHVVEAAPRVLGRGVPDQVAAWLADLHCSRGVRITAGVPPTEVRRAGGRVTGVRLADGSALDADLVVVGVGVAPRDGLGRDAGLAVDDGIVVDRSCRTSHPDVFAAGDCARMRGPAEDRGTRLESYQPAGRQGQVAAGAMAGGQDSYLDVPWTWSDQYDAMMQTAGLVPVGAQTLCCGDDGAVLVLSFALGRLVAACGVAPGVAIARPVRAATQAIRAGGLVDRAALTAVAPDLAAVTRLLRAAA